MASRARRREALWLPVWARGLRAAAVRTVRCRPPAPGDRLHPRRHGLAAGFEPGWLCTVAARPGATEPMRERPGRNHGDRNYIRHALAAGADHPLGPLGHRDVWSRTLHVRQPHAN